MRIFLVAFLILLTATGCLDTDGEIQGQSTSESTVIHVDDIGGGALPVDVVIGDVAQLPPPLDGSICNASEIIEWTGTQWDCIPTPTVAGGAATSVPVTGIGPGTIPVGVFLPSNQITGALNPLTQLNGSVCANGEILESDGTNFTCVVPSTVATSVPASGITAGAIGVGVTLPANQVIAGTFGAGVLIPSTQITGSINPNTQIGAGALNAGVTLATSQLTGTINPATQLGAGNIPSSVNLSAVSQLPAPLNGVGCAVGEMLQRTAVGWACIAIPSGADNLGNHTATADLDMATNLISNLGAPVAGTDAATKGYVDTQVAGAGTVTSVGSGVGLTGGPITGSGTLNVDVGTGANQIVQLDGTSRLPAVDGSQLTNLPAAPVTSVHSRTGIVTAQNGDYTASQVTNTPAGTIAAVTTQAAIDELATEKLNTTGGALSGNLAMGTNLITGLGTPVAGTDAATKAYVDTQVAGAPGDNLGNHTATTNLNLNNNEISNLGAGGLGAPSLSFQGDSDTGIFRPAANEIAFAEDGIQVFTLRRSNSDLRRQLSVTQSGVGGGFGGGIRLQASDGAGNYTGFQAPNSLAAEQIYLLPSDVPLNGEYLRWNTGGNLSWEPLSASTILSDADNNTLVQVEETGNEDFIRFDTAGSERMVIDDSGNLGIGTASPSALAHIVVTNTSGFNDTGLYIDGHTGGDHLLKVRSTGVPSTATDSDTRFIVRGSGAVGVGEAAPEGRFHVVGGASGFTDRTVTIDGPAQSGDHVFLVRTSASPASATNADTKFAVLGGGDVGIGTITPESRLQVAGAIQIANDTDPCVALKAGAIRYNGGVVEYCDSSTWIAFGTAAGGEVNTASNLGVGGVGLFDGKSGVQLQFKNINQASNKIVITDDVINNEVDIDVVEANIDHDALANFVSNEHIDHSSVSVTAGTGLTGGGDITASRTLNVNVGTGANQIVQLDGTSRLPAVDGSQLTNLPAAPVTSVHSRTGIVTAQSGDYTATQITNTPAGGVAAVTTQAAINELDTEKLNTSGGALSGNLAMGTNLITGLGTPVAGTDAATKAYVDTQVGGAGDDLGDHTATQNIVLGSNYLSGDGGNEGIYVNGAGKVGVGTNAPLGKLHIVTDSPASSIDDDLALSTFADNSSPAFATQRARGTLAAPAPVENDDIIGSLWTSAFNGAAFVDTGYVAIRAENDFSVVAADQDAYMVVNLLENGSRSEKMRVTSAGRLGLGTANPAVELDVNTGSINASEICDENNANCIDLSVAQTSGTVTSVGSGVGLTGGPITGSGTLNVNVGTGANQIVQLDGTSRLPAVDGSQLTNLPAAPVTSVHSRTGIVTAQNGDYTASQVTNVPAGSIAAVTTQAAINELDTEKLNTTGGALSGNLAMGTNLITGLGTPVAGTDAATKAYVDTQVAGAPGDNLGDHTAAQNIVLGSNYLSGDGGNEGIAIDAAGNVGVGSASPLNDFSVGLDFLDISGGDTISVGHATLPTYALQRTINDRATIQYDSSNRIQFSTVNGGVNYTNSMTIVDGNVGIGTASPDSSLQVAGAIQIANDADPCVALKAGAIRYNGGVVEYCDSSTWIAFGTAAGGEVNTASNLGVGGVGLFDGKSGVQLQFKNINQASNKIVITDDVINNEVDIDVVEANIDHDALANFVSNEHIDHSSVSVTAGTGLTGGGDITASRTLNVNVGTGANQIVQLDGTSRLPAVDGSQLTNLPAAPVTSVHGRAGVVAAQNGDYTASQVTNVPAGTIAAITTQAAIDELATEKLNTTGGSLSGNLAMGTNLITGLGTPVAGTDAATKAYVDTQVAGAPGDDLGNHTATQNIVLGSNYLSGDGGNEGIAIDASGNVGIGTVSPGSELQISGTTPEIMALYPGQSHGGISALSANRVAFTSIAQTNDLVFGWSAGHKGAFTEYMRVDNATGRVGIGTAAPTVELDINTGSINASEICDENNANCIDLSVAQTSGTVTSVGSGVGLTGGPITGSGILNVNVGTGANQIVQLDGTSRLPAVDGSQLTNLPAAPVTSVHSRTGIVTAQNGDYTATQITNTPAGTIAAITTQAAIDELATEKLNTTGGALSGNLAMGTNLITGLGTPVAGTDAATKAYVDTQVGAVPGDNLGSHTATTNIQLGSNYLSGDGGNEGVAIDAAGNVGIGNSSPSELLVIGDDPGANMTTGTGVVIGSSAGPVASLFLAEDSTNYGVMSWNTANDLLSFTTREAGTAYTNTLNLKAGDVGVGTSAPESRLQVAGAIQIANDTDPCVALKAGAIRYNGGVVEYCDSSTWIAFGTAAGGEVNTASNIGVSGVGLFDGKSGVQLQFKSINQASNKIVITDDVINNEVDIDVVEANIDHDALSNFVSNEHVDHSSVSITAGTGLTGGGTIAATRTLNVNTGVGVGQILQANDVPNCTAGQKLQYAALPIGGWSCVADVDTDTHLVTSVHGRAGVVAAQAGDYTATQITNAPAGSIAAVTTQAAIDELATEKLNTTGGTLSGNLAMGTNLITGLGTPVAGTDAATKAYVDTQVGSAPGDNLGSHVAGQNLNMSNHRIVGLNAGSAAAPGLHFNSDADTGLFRPTGDTVAFSLGGSEVFRIDSAGDTGIGSSSPIAALHVERNGTNRSTITSVSDVTAFITRDATVAQPGNGDIGAVLGFGNNRSHTSLGAAIGIKQTSADPDGTGLAFLTQPTLSIGPLVETMTLTNGGNLGIGTTSPAVELDVNTGSINASEICDENNANCIDLSVAQTSGTVTSVGSGVGLTGGPITGSGTLNVDVGVGTGQILQANDVPNCTAGQKLQYAALPLGGWSCVADVDTDTHLVTSVFGRAGVVAPLAGDYTASQVTNVPAGSIAAVTTQAAIDELATEKLNTTGGTLSGNLVMGTNLITGLGTPVAGTDAATKAYVDAQVGAAPGDDLGDHTATTNIQLGSNYLSGDGGNEGVFVGSTGNVGIGTSTLDSRLNVQTSATGNIATFRIDGATRNPGIRVQADEATGVSTLDFTGSSFGVASFEIRGTEAMRIDANRRVGIGTDTPNHPLDVVGNVNSTGDYHLPNTGGHVRAGGSRIYLESPSNLVAFYTNGAEVARLSEDRFGIGTISPAVELDVNTGTINAASICDENNANCIDLSVAQTSGTVTSVGSGVGLTGGPITGSGALNVDVGVGANQIVQLDGTSRLPAVDGSQLTNLPAAPVTSVHSRTGIVTAQNGDYTATQITNAPAGTIAAITTQAAINELDTEKLNITGGALSGNLAMGTNLITGLGTPVAGTDAATKAYVDTQVGAAPGDDLGNHTATTDLNMSNNVMTNLADSGYALSFNGDADTGIQRTNTNEFSLYAGGNSILTVGGSAITLFQPTFLGHFQTATYDASTVLANSPSGSSLHVYNTDNTDNSYAGIEFRHANAASTIQRAYMGVVSNTAGETPDIVIGQQSGATAYDERLRIDSNGNIGIGTTSPSAKLHIGDGADNLLVTSSGDLQLNGTGDYLVSGNRFAFRYSGNENAGLLYNSSQAGYQFLDTAGSSIIHIGNNSRIGIGVTSPVVELDVNTGTINAASICDENNANCIDLSVAQTSGTVTSVGSGVGLTGGPITGSGTLNVDVGTGANQIVQLDGTSRLPAVDGSQLTNLPAAPVTSVFGRAGVVVPLAGDYTATQITNTPAGTIAAVTTQAAIDELDTEKLNITGGALSGNLAMGTNLITGLGAPVAGTDAATKAYVDTQVGAAPGDNLGDHEATQNIDLADNRLVGDGGSEGISIDGAGNVGIGTGTPAGILDVQGGTAAASTAGRAINLIAETSGAGAGNQGGSVNISVGDGAGGWQDGDVNVELLDNGRAYFNRYYDVAYSSSGATAYPGLHMVLNNATLGDDRASYLNLRVRNGAGNYQHAYMGAVSATGGATYTPDLVFGQQTGASSYAEQMRLSAAGNLGIGTDNPAVELDVNTGVINASAICDENNANCIDLSAGGAGDDLGDHTATTNIQLGSNYLSGDGGNEGVSVDSNGNVGIGTTSPSQKLDVMNGLIRSEIWSSTVQDQLILENVATPITAGQGSKVSFRGGSTFLGGLEMSWDSTNNFNASMIFETRGSSVTSEKMRLSASGRLGIGTNNPAVELDVDTGVINASAICDESNANCIDLSVGAAASSIRSVAANPGAGNVAGDVVYNTTDGITYFYSGSAWVPMASSGGSNAAITNADPATNLTGVSAGAIAYDTTDSEFQVYNGSSWVTLGAAGAGDDLGNHTATTTLNMSNNTMSNLGLGTSALPAISFNGDSGTGVSSPYSGAMEFSSGGSGVMTLDAASLYGVAAGSANILMRHGGGNAQPTYAFFQDDDTGMYRATADELAFGTDGNERVRIDKDGYVGIGTNDPNKLLDVEGVGAAAHIHLTHTGGADSATFYGAQYADSSGVTGTTFMGLGSRGTLASPSALLDGDQALYITGQAATDSSWTTRDIASIEMKAAENVSNTSSAGEITFRTTPTGSTTPVEAMIIQSDGDVGIGTSNPDELLTVDNGTSIGRYTTTGWTHTSDRRLKRDIASLENPLEKVLKLEPVEYSFKKDKSRSLQLGFIAQKVEEIFPEVVVTGAKGIKSLVYDGLISPLVGAVKELYAMVMDLFDITTEHAVEIAKLKEENSKKDLKIQKLENDMAEIKALLKSRAPASVED